jgi:hypothetical protein
MVGPTLYDDVARVQGDLGVVEHQRDLPLEHDAVVDRLGAMHRRLETGRVRETGLELVDPDLGAAGRRRDRELALGRLRGLGRVDRGGRSAGVPDLVEGDAVLGNLLAHRHRAVGHHDRDAVGGVSGDDAARDGAHLSPWVVGQPV